MTIVILLVIIGVTVASQKSTPATVEASSSQFNNDVLSTLKAIEGRLEKIENNTLASANVLKGFQMAAPNQKGQQPPPEDMTKVYNIDVAHSYVQGNKKAPVTIVEFMDFQCPFCARFHPVIQEVLKAYPDQVNYVLKNFPLSFHQQARPAAKAALAAGEQGKYYEMTALLIKNSSSLSDDKYKELAKELGLNVDQFTKDLKDKDGQWEDILSKDAQLAGEVQVRGTPTYFINGRRTMSRDLNAFKAEVDKILSEKK